MATKIITNLQMGARFNFFLRHEMPMNKIKKL